ncbi:MAG: dTDP-4-dehydrorhamnose reductase [Granulosicoccus sp.]|jgi:dTDP-4-dehydrorhamnose reductase
MRILITGSNGLLGQKMVYALKADPEVELIATARGENRLIDHEGYEYSSMDITDHDNVMAIVTQFKPDRIIHGAAMTNVDACETDREGCDLANVTAVQNIVDAAEAVGAHLVHLSTDFIFDGKDGPYEEDAVPNPVSYYGLSKLKGEEIVMASELEWAICRTVLVYGVVDNMSRSNFVLWAKGELEQGKNINVVDDQFRSPTLAEDLAQGCILASKQKANGVFNISGEDTDSILGLITTVADHYGLDKTLINPTKSDALGQPAKRPPRTGFIIEKARKELGYEPHSFTEGIVIMENQLKGMTQ